MDLQQRIDEVLERAGMLRHWSDVHSMARVVDTATINGVKRDVAPAYRQRLREYANLRIAVGYALDS